MNKEVAMARILTKTETIIKLLHRSKGASISQLQTVTGWQPHSIRAAMTGLRKRGHEIERRRKGAVSSYHIAQPGTKA
jgi:hypothetical protein